VRTATAQHAGSAQVADAASHPFGRVSGVTRYLHSYNRVIPCPIHVITRQRKGVDMHIPKLVCIPCKREMVISHTGMCIELAHTNGHKIKVYADVYECKGCFTATARMAEVAAAQGRQPSYDEWRIDLVARFADDKAGIGGDDGEG